MFIITSPMKYSEVAFNPAASYTARWYRSRSCQASTHPAFLEHRSKVVGPEEVDDVGDVGFFHFCP